MSDYEGFEEGLKRELRRVPAPEGFADRVVQRAAAEERRGRLVVPPHRAIWPTAWLAVAAMLIVGIVLGGWQWRQRELRHEREQALVVQRQLDLAMQVTQRTLEGVQERVGQTIRGTVRQ